VPTGHACDQRRSAAAWEAERTGRRFQMLCYGRGSRVMMHFESVEGSLPDIQEIKRSFARAMHRKALSDVQDHW